MKLLPLSADQLLAHASLPFSVYTQDGVKLLSAHTSLDDPLVRDQLRRLTTVYAYPSEYEGWLHSPEREWARLLHGKALPPLLAQASSRTAERNRPATLEEEWEQTIVMLDHVMQHPDADCAWLARVLEIHAHVRALSAHRLDEALFHLLFTGSSRWSFYSSRQALRCMLIAGEAARALEWDEARIAQLEKAALTMNVTVWRLQDQLTQYPGGIESAEDRARIERHPADSARLLLDHGVKETVWLEAVWLHHDTGLASRPLSSLAPGQQAGLLLHRVDCYSAMLSRRARAQPLSSLQVAQQACLGPDGLPDPLGAVLLKAIGLYPPGTFVALASNESGVVLERGEHANTPVVAALTNREGMVMAEPRLRYTSHRDSAVRSALPFGKVLVDPPLDKLRALRTFLHSP